MLVKPKLLEILKERGLTQTELAGMAGIPQAAVSRFDKSMQHSDEHLFRISQALELRIEDLFKVEEQQG
jgi:transcriptional regulator with XRE-family HTH domain